MKTDVRDRVYALCWRVLRHRQDAEDAAQDALLKIARQGASVDPARYDAWIYRVALNAAIDLSRRRMRRAIPSRTSAAPDPLALHEAVAELPDPERAAVVEHFFHRRTLRDIAADEGVTEQAIWKRVERAKDRLRRALALAAGAALPALEADIRRSGAAPLALTLGLAPVALLVAFGTAAWVRPEAPPRVPVPLAPTAALVPVPRAPAPALLPSPAAPPSVRRPYPLALPAAAWPKPRADAWRRLYQGRITLSLSDASMRDIFGEMARLSGEIFLWEDVDVQALMTMQMSDTTIGECLSYTCELFGLVFDVQDDGTVRLFRPDRAPRERLEELHRLQERRRILGEVEERLAAAGTLQAPDLGRPRPLPAGDTPAERLFQLCTEARLELVTRDLGDDFGERIHVPAPSAPGDRALSEHLDLFCAAFGLGWWEEDARVTLAPPELAAARREAVRAEGARWEAELDLPLGPPAASYAELAERLEALLRRPVVLSEALWTSERVPPASTSVREAIRDVDGVRWTRRGGLLVGVLR